MSRSQQLLAQLEAFAPRDGAEQRHLERIRELLTQSAAPFSRDQFVPGHVTASAFVLSPERQRVLLIWHRKLRAWLQPGGHVDTSDRTVLDAARREVSEETSIDDLTLLGRGVFDIDIHRIPPFAGNPAHEHFDVRFLFHAESAEHRAGSDAGEARWVALTDPLLVTGDASVTRAISKIEPESPG